MEISEALAFAAQGRNGVIVTQRRNGRPQISNITYLLADGEFSFSVAGGRAKIANIRRDPRVSMYVGGPEFSSYVVVEGDATMTAPAAAVDDDATEALVDLYRRIAGEHPDWDEYRAAMVADGRLVVTVRPTYAYGLIR